MSPLKNTSTTKTSSSRIFASQKGQIGQQRKYSRNEHQKKAVFIAFTALLPHSNILPPQKIDPLFVKILLSHKGRSDKENILIRYLTSLAHLENSTEIDSEKNLLKTYENIAALAKDFVESQQDYSKASIAVDTMTLICRLTNTQVPENFDFYLEKAALFFLDKEANIMEYINARKMVHPSIMKRSLEYAKLALHIASHYGMQTGDKELVKLIEQRHHTLQSMEKKLQTGEEH